MGEHARELAVARDGLSRHPELRILAVYELRALAALGRVDELDARMQTLPTRFDSTVATESTIRQVALELSAHGNDKAAQRLLDRLSASYAQLETGSLSRSDPLSVARTYYLFGDYAKALPIYDSVFRAHPRCLDCEGIARRPRRAARRSRDLRIACARVGGEGSSRGRTSSVGRSSGGARIANLLGDRSSARRPAYRGLRERLGVRRVDAHRSRSHTPLSRFHLSSVCPCSIIARCVQSLLS